LDGSLEGFWVGLNVGSGEGTWVGCREGSAEGSGDGLTDGFALGTSEGVADGAFVEVRPTVTLEGSTCALSTPSAAVAAAVKAWLVREVSMASTNAGPLLMLLDPAPLSPREERGAET
jgi:hypothetical protein